MKLKAYIWAVSLSVTMAGTSCSRFLEENPRDSLPEEAAYNSLQDLFRNGVISLYTHIGGNADSQGLQGTGRGVYDLNTFTTDEAIMPTRGGDWYDGGFWQGLYLHRWGVNNDAIHDTWEYLYKVVNRCNHSLKQMDNYAATHPGDDIRAYRSEVRAIRAMYYYYLLDLFGQLPLVTVSEVNPEELQQMSRSKIYHFIIEELQESVPYLAEKRSNVPGEYYGRITRPVAWFLLAKLALNAEIYADDNWTDGTAIDGKNIRFNVEGQQLNAWQAVIHYCNLITAMGYKLEPDYTANFAVFNESSTENIFTIPMDKTLYSNQYIYLFRSRHYNHAKAYGLGGENGASATREVLDVFGYGTENPDPRFEWSYYYDEVRDLNGNRIYLDDGTQLVYLPREIALDLSGQACEQTAGARMKKYEIDAGAFKDGRLIDNDIVLYRYADVLLMLSEAKVRSGMDGTAELNAVRSRAGAAPRTATLETLLEERMLELSWEGWRRQDLIRFRQYTRSYSFRPAVENESTGFTTVFPIPDKVLKMNPRLKQNPGYESDGQAPAG